MFEIMFMLSLHLEYHTSLFFHIIPRNQLVIKKRRPFILLSLSLSQHPQLFWNSSFSKKQMVSPKAATTLSLSVSLTFCKFFTHEHFAEIVIWLPFLCSKKCLIMFWVNQHFSSLRAIGRGSIHWAWLCEANITWQREMVSILIEPGWTNYW